MWLRREEIWLRQMAKVSWINQGEASEKKFCAMKPAKTKKIANMKLSDGRVLVSPEAVHTGL